MVSRYRQLGLVKNHAHFITDAYHLSEQDEDIKILKVVNPHGTQDWKGKWSDHDPGWTDYYKQVFGYDNRLPGEFFIDFINYLLLFESTSI